MSVMLSFIISLVISVGSVFVGDLSSEERAALEAQYQVTISEDGFVQPDDF